MNRGEKRPGEPDGAYGTSQPRARGLGRGNEQESSAAARRKLEAMFSGSGSGSSGSSSSSSSSGNSGAPAFGRAPQVGEQRLRQPAQGHGAHALGVPACASSACGSPVRSKRSARPPMLFSATISCPTIRTSSTSCCSIHPRRCSKTSWARSRPCLMQRRLGKLMILDARLSEVSARIEGEVTKQFVAGLREQMLRFSSETAAPVVVTSLGRAS